ncbi:MAG TPA: hypothetical protein VJ754_00460, partial [Anaerolineae bacterium]|nr:hypothetical protein [Anaerolineae bacterium]
MFDMLLAVEQADDRQTVITLADFQREFDDPWSNPEMDSLIALTPAGQAAAFARTFQNPQPEDENRCFLWVDVHPAQRGRGLEDFLLDWSEARARQRLLAMDNGLPRVMRYGLQDTQADLIARLESRGFSPVRYFYRMRRDLREPIPAVRLPDGLTLRPFTPALSQAVQDAINEAFRD